MDTALFWRQRIIFENNFLDSSIRQYPGIMTDFDGEGGDDIAVGRLLINHQEETSSALNERDISNFMNLSDGEMMNLISPFFTTEVDINASATLLQREPPVTPHEFATPGSNDELVSETPIEIIQHVQLPQEKEELRTPAKNPQRVRKPKLPTKRKTIKKDRRANRSIHLWEFLRELLTSGNCNYIQWISEEDGTFRLVNSSAVAKLWGERKNRNNMTYEKMSRALRYYYEKQILERVPNARLIYKFGNRTRSTPSETSEESLSDCSDN